MHRHLFGCHDAYKAAGLSPDSRNILTLLCMGHNIRWCLDKLDQHPLPTQRVIFVTFWVNKSNIVTACPFSDAPGSEAHSLTCQPLHTLGEWVHPQPDMVQSRDMDSARHREKTTMSTVCESLEVSGTIWLGISWSDSRLTAVFGPHLGAFSGSIGSIRSTSTALTPWPTFRMSSHTFSFCSQRDAGGRTKKRLQRVL